jgi:hypothetical protein
MIGKIASYVVLLLWLYLGFIALLPPLYHCIVVCPMWSTIYSFTVLLHWLGHRPHFHMPESWWQPQEDLLPQLLHTEHPLDLSLLLTELSMVFFCLGMNPACQIHSPSQPGPTPPNNFNFLLFYNCFPLVPPHWLTWPSVRHNALSALHSWFLPFSVFGSPSPLYRVKQIPYPQWATALFTL